MITVIYYKKEWEQRCGRSCNCFEGSGEAEFRMLHAPKLDDAVPLVVGWLMDDEEASTRSILVIDSEAKMPEDEDWQAELAAYEVCVHDGQNWAAVWTYQDLDLYSFKDAIRNAYTKAQEAKAAVKAEKERRAKEKQQQAMLASKRKQLEKLKQELGEA